MNEILDISALRKLAVSTTTADLLTVLSILEALNRLGPALAVDAVASQGKSADAGFLVPGLVPRSEFVSNNVAPKLAQQLKVCCAVLIICTHHLLAKLSSAVDFEAGTP